MPVYLLYSLEAIAKDIGDEYFEGIIRQIASDVKAGMSFSEALRKHTSVFGEIYISMIKAAESSGQLAFMLQNILQLIEGEIDTRQRIQMAIRYPLLVVLALCIAFLVLSIFVIPRFIVVYAQFNTALPLPTRVMIGLYIALKKFWYLFLAVIGGAIYGFLRFINSKRGRPLWDNFRIRIYIIGPLLKMLVISRFARVTAIMMRSGVPILDVLELAANTSGNVIISRVIRNIKDSVIQGKGISEPMRLSNLFPAAVIQMVSAGEQTGKTAELLLGVADYYDRESGYLIKNLTTYIEPALIFLLGIMVLGLALAIFLPMWNLYKLFQH